MKKRFIPRTDAEKRLWLQNFQAKLAGYKAKYALTQADIDDIVAGYTYIAFWLDHRNNVQNYLKKLTQYKNEIIYGIPAGATASVVPAVPVLGTVPPAVAPGLFTRVTSIAVAIKKKTNYTIADGEDLGIEGAQMGIIDIHDSQPSIDYKLVKGGYPEIIWHKGEFDGVDIYVDHGTGTWEFLATDTHPNFIDTTALPAAGKSEVRRYQAIYRLHDEQVGKYSDPLTVTVTGSI